MQEKQRFLKMADEKAAFEEAIKSRRAADFDALQVWCYRPHSPHATHCLSGMKQLVRML